MSREGPWLFSRRVDLLAFLGTAVVSFLLLGLGAALGILDEPLPDWVWVPAVLLIDVAHVWSTAFRVYLDPKELRRRPLLYATVPVLGYAALFLLARQGDQVFWRGLAYVAVFHFVRQQWGWVALYRSRAGETDRLGRFLDAAAVGLATLHPLVAWHASLPRRIEWFLQGDFVALPAALARVTAVLHALALGVYVLRAAAAWARGRPNPGKDVVVLTTAACWWVGIVALDSDFAFTVTNVIIHGVPYLVLVWWYGEKRSREPDAGPAFAIFAAGPLAYVLVLAGVAYVEELLWHRGITGERAWLFGDAWELPHGARTLLAPLLALPQFVHYVLDGFIWVRRKNPEFDLVQEPA